VSRAAKPRASQPPPATEAPTELRVTERPGVSRERKIADLVAEGRVGNAAVTRQWTVGLFGGPDQRPDLTELLAAVDDIGDRVAEGDRAELERLLTSQAIALNMVFANLMQRAHHSEIMVHFEANIRLALRAQTQCRATVQTLAEMKMPTVFARQANIANGHQQVTNVTHLHTGEPSRAGSLEAAPNKLLEAHGERLDTGTATETSRGDPALVPMAALHRPKDRTG
jgi:hypothetical protein